MRPSNILLPRKDVILMAVNVPVQYQYWSQRTFSQYTHAVCSDAPSIKVVPNYIPVHIQDAFLNAMLSDNEFPKYSQVQMAIFNSSMMVFNAMPVCLFNARL